MAGAGALMRPLRSPCKDFHPMIAGLRAHGAVGRFWAKDYRGFKVAVVFLVRGLCPLWQLLPVHIHVYTYTRKHKYILHIDMYDIHIHISHLHIQHIHMYIDIHIYICICIYIIIHLHTVHVLLTLLPFHTYLPACMPTYIYT